MPSRFVSWLKTSKSTGSYYSFFIPAAFLLCLALLVGTIFVGKDHTEKSLKWGMDVIRGSRYPKITSENLQPQPSPQPSPQTSPEPPPQPSPQPSPQPPREPPPQPSLQPSPQPPPEPPPQPSPQPLRQTPPQPQSQTQQPPSLQPQVQLQTQTQPQPQMQPQVQLQTQTQPQPQPQPQMQQQPSPQLQPQMQQQPSPQPQPQMQQQPSPQLQQQTQTQMQPQPSPQLQPQQEDQKCLYQSQCRPPGSEPLPKGLVANTADLQMQPLWGRHQEINSSTCLFTAAVGIKQKETVDKMVMKFLSSNFNVMLFHYDGVVDAWKDLDWASSVVHVAAVNQTKWWFAKRFLHPDIVSEYSHIFLWDEDLGVENFHPDRYLSIVKDEGLEISQPALDKEKSEVHHTITARWSNSTVHRRVKPGGNRRGCDWESKDPPCAGWIELMAPVFSRTAWQCIWYMIQKDLNHAWGLDILFGYCAQGDRTKNVGVVDAEYIVHYAFPTFGEPQNQFVVHKWSHSATMGYIWRESCLPWVIYGETSNDMTWTRFLGNSDPSEPNARMEVRRQSYREYKIFKRRWQIAAKEDESWVDPYAGSLDLSII